MLNMFIVSLEACQSPSQSEDSLYTDPSTIRLYIHSFIHSSIYIHILEIYRFYFDPFHMEMMKCVFYSIFNIFLYVLLLLLHQINRCQMDGFSVSYTIVIISMYTSYIVHHASYFKLLFFFHSHSIFFFYLLLRFVVIFV